MPFDWENSGPTPEARAALEAVSDEAEFPYSYSGQAWRAAYRILRAYKDQPAELLKIGPYDDIPGVALSDLDLTGFMFGWALNAARQLCALPPGPNGAIVNIGEPMPLVPASGPADADLRRVLGAPTKPEGT